MVGADVAAEQQHGTAGEAFAGAMNGFPRAADAWRVCLVQLPGWLHEAHWSLHQHSNERLSCNAFIEAATKDRLNIPHTVPVTQVRTAELTYTEFPDVRVRKLT